MLRGENSVSSGKFSPTVFMGGPASEIGPGSSGVVRALGAIPLVFAVRPPPPSPLPPPSAMRILHLMGGAHIGRGEPAMTVEEG